MFIALTNNAFVLIYYITNYATKIDTSQYQRIVMIVFMKNAYDEALFSIDTTRSGTSIGFLDKFTLRTLNRLAYD